MFSSEVLEIAIGVVFVFLVASLLATAVREAIEGFLKTRAIQLERGIRQMLDDPTGTAVTKQLFDHPLLFGLFAGEYDPAKLTGFLFNWRRGGSTQGAGGKPVPPKRIGFFTNLPAYIPSGNFALALMHLTAGTDGMLTIESVKNGTMQLPEGRLRQAMLVALGEAQGDLDRARASLESWFDSTMDRVSGWYKRETSVILFAIGLVVAVVLNVDTLQIADTLASNNALRQQLIAHIDATIKGDQSPSEQMLAGEVQGLSGVIGWTQRKQSIENELATPAREADREKQKVWAKRQMELFPFDHVFWRFLPKAVVGWFVSALAISLGAPFWFDVLNKLMIIRSTVKPYEKSPPEASADRGSVARADALAPTMAPAPVAGGGGAQASSAAAAGAAVAPVPATATLRLAFEGADPGTITLSVDGSIAVHVPNDGFIEVPLTAGASHEVVARGTKGDATVVWSRKYNLIENDDLMPVAAALEKVGA